MADYTLSAKITGDASSFKKSMDQTVSKLKETSDKVKNLGKNVTNISKNIMGSGTKLSLGLTLPLVAGAKQAVSYASDLQEVQNVVDVTFGKSSGIIDKFAKKSGDSFGLSELQAKQYNGTLGAMLKSSGLTGDAVVDMSTDLTGLSADMASFYNLDHDTAFDKIRAGISGETEPLKQLGINMSVANLEAYALAEGIKKPYDEMSQGEQTQLRYGYLMQATADAQGDFARTGDSHANMVKKMQLAMANMSNTIGTLLLPYATKLVTIVTDVINKFNGLSPTMMKTVLIIAAVAAAIGPVLIIVGALGVGLGTLITAFGVLISPIGLVITAIVGLAAAFGYQMATNEKFRTSFFEIFDSIREKVSNVIAYITPIVQGLWSKVQPILSNMADALPGLFEKIGPTVMSTLGNVGTQISKVFTTIWGIVQAVIPIFTTFFSSLLSGFQSAGVSGDGFVVNLTTILFGLSPVIKGIILLFQNFGPQIVGAFQTVVSMLLPVIATIGTTIGQLSATVIPILMSAFATLIPIIVQVGMTFMNIVTTVLPVLISLFNQFVPIITQVVLIFAGIIAQVIPLVGVLISSLLPVIQNVITTFMNIVTSVAPAFIAIIQAIITIVQALVPVFMAILTVAIQVFANIMSTISPIVGFIGNIIVAIMAIVTPIIVFIAGIITSIVAVITPLITIVSGVFSTIFSVVSGIFRNIMSFVGGAINKVGSVISGLTGTVSKVFNNIFGTVSRIMGNVSSKISDIFSAIQNAWSGLTGFVGGIFAGISGSVSDLVGQVKGFVNGVIGGINSAVGLINKIPGVSIGKIPYLARGTDDFQGGFARINEGGRGELVNMPGGTQVIPHDVSMRYAREAGKQSASQNGSRQSNYQRTDTSRIESLLERIANSEQMMVLDTGELIGATYPQYDRTGGTKTKLDGRFGRS